MTDQHRQDTRQVKDLKVTDETFRLLVERVRDYAIFLLDPQGNVMTWNPGAETLKGYRANEIIGCYFGCFYEESDAIQGKPEQLLQVAEQEGRVEDEGWRVRKDGTRFWADVLITLLRDKHGEVRGFAKITRDLTERRQAALRLEKRVQERTAELEQSNAKLSETVNELEQFHDMVVDRELKMIELEKRIIELEAALKSKPLGAEG